jgi:hypothetical protein
MPLATEITKAIDANLPSEVGKRLQARLEDADRLEKEVGYLKQRIAGLEPNIIEHAKLEGIRRELDEKEHEHAKKVVDFHIQKVRSEVTLEQMEQRLKDHETFINLLLGNRIVRERVQQAIPVSFGGSVQYDRVVVPGGEHVEKHETTRETEQA